MPDLGNKLREKRISLGYSLDDIQEKTKIQKRYLEAIEDSDFARLPGSFYVRAFIRHYAESLNMDADELLNELDPHRKVADVVHEQPHSYRKEAKEAVSPQPSLSRIRNEKERLNHKYSKIIDLIPKILLILSILGIVFCIWKFSPFFKENGKENPNQTQQEDGPQMNVNDQLDPADQLDQNLDDTKDNPEDQSKDNPDDIVPPSENVEASLTAVKTEENVTTYELKGANQFQVRVVSNGLSYIDIKDSAGEMVYSGEITEGDEVSYDFSEERSIQLNLGRSTDVIVYVNDEELAYEIPPTEAVHQKIVINFTPLES